MKFGENLKNLRKAKKLSQEELAEKVGISRQSVSKWECSEAYPEMINIFCLCDIFKCKINDLVHEDLSDLDSLDEEIKMTIVKFEQAKQKRVKGLSKVIFMLARIGKIFMIIALTLMVLLMLGLPVLINNVKVLDEDRLEIFKQTINYHYQGNTLILTHDDQEVKLIGSEQYNYLDLFTNNSNLKLIGFGETAMVFAVVTLGLVYLILKYLEQLFMNIHQGETPFTLENANYLKQVAYLMIAVIILPFISGTIMQMIIAQDLGISFELFDLIYILFLFSMVYIFEYGYAIQLDSKGKMYGEE